MMQNGLGESFWDAHGVEIGACTIFKDFGDSPNFGDSQKNGESDALGGRGAFSEG